MESGERRERLITVVKEGYAMKQFIKEDLKKSLSQQKQESTFVVETMADGIDMARINSLLIDAEKNAKMREAIGSLDPHRNITHGSKFKVFVKKVVRKLSWWMVRPIVDSQNYHNALNDSISNAVRDSVCMLKDVVSEQQKEISELKQKLESYSRKNELNNMKKEVAKLTAEQTRVNEFFRDNVNTLKDIINKQKKEISMLQQNWENANKKEETIYDYIDYSEFENAFRGSQQEICNRIKRYLSYFKEGDYVVDLGCGRGEWLGLLEANGIKAIGIDMNPAFINICREKGLHVEECDFFNYLEKLPDASVNGITAIQVIEHITPVELARLVKLCYKKVKFGGHVILETQNPMVVSTMTNYFFIDPTHERPVHPYWIKYLMEKALFTDIALEYPEYAWVIEGSIPSLEGTSDNAATFNYKISYLNNLLYGSTDYAIIAKK